MLFIHSHDEWSIHLNISPFGTLVCANAEGFSLGVKCFNPQWNSRVTRLWNHSTYSSVERRPSHISEAFFCMFRNSGWCKNADVRSYSRLAGALSCLLRLTLDLFGCLWCQSQNQQMGWAKKWRFSAFPMCGTRPEHTDCLAARPWKRESISNRLSWPGGVPCLDFCVTGLTPSRPHVKYH